MPEEEPKENHQKELPTHLYDLDEGKVLEQLKKEKLRQIIYFFLNTPPRKKEFQSKNTFKKKQGI